MDDFSGWIGRAVEQEDEIGRAALRRIAAMLDLDDFEFPVGAVLPAHWYAMFFPDVARQSALGVDGHPRRGEFLPPIPLPRRMLAGRRVRFLGALHVGDVARKRSEIVAVTPKTGRSGATVFVTVLHSISVDGTVVVTEEQDIVYREAAAAGVAPRGGDAPPAGAWSAPFAPSATLLFRYSAITFNGHRIHYDADYTREEEHYPALVVNGGLSLLMLLQAANAHLGQAPVSVAVRNLRPLLATGAATLGGTLVEEGKAEGWVCDGSGMVVRAELRF